MIASVAPLTGDQPVRSVNLRALRAANRVYLCAAHADALLGVGHHPTPVWAGMLGETLFLERLAVGGGNRHEVKGRVAGVTAATTRVGLTVQSLATLDLRSAPPWGHGAGVAASLSGPRGAVMLPDGVFLAAPRLLLPDGVARRLGLRAGAVLGIEVPAWGEPVASPIILEVPAGLREGVVVLDGPVADRLGEPGPMVTVLLTAAPGPDAA